MDLEKQKAYDRSILRGIYELMLNDTPAEFEAILLEHPELATPRAINLIESIIGDIHEVDVCAEWEKRVKFLAGKIKSIQSILPSR